MSGKDGKDGKNGELTQGPSPFNSNYICPLINSDITVTFIQVSLKHFVATFYVYLTQQMAVLQNTL